MTDKIIVKSIYELNKIESLIVNNTIERFLKLYNIQHHIISIKVKFTGRDYHKVLNEYMTLIIDKIELKTDLGDYDIEFYSDMFKDEFSRYLVVNGNNRIENKNLVPVVQFFSRSYAPNKQYYSFILKWIKPKLSIKDKLKEYFKSFLH